MENPNPRKHSPTRRPMLLITYAVLLFVVLYRIEAVWGALTWFLKAISPLFTGLMLAYLFHMPMNFFQYRLLGSWENSKRPFLRKLWPGVSMLLAYLLVFAFLLGLGALVLPRAIESVAVLLENFSGYLNGFEAWADSVMSSLSLTPFATDIVSDLWAQAVAFLQSVMKLAVNGAVNFTVSVTSRLLDFMLAFMFSIFLLAGRKSTFRQVRRLASRVIGEARANKCGELLRLCDEVFSNFILGKIADAFILGVLCFSCMSLFNMDYALLISAIVAVTELVPIVGPLVGTIACGIILLVISPAQALGFVILVVILQQVEGNIIYPRMMGSVIGLPGMWVIVSIIVGGGLFGIWGMLLGTPLFAVCYRLLTRNQPAKEL